jgi:hypothetical protein
VKIVQPITNIKKKQPGYGLKFDLADDKETKTLVGYMKWHLHINPLNEEKPN